MCKPVAVAGNRDSDQVFAGSIPDAYETFLVPLIFQPYADDLASRVVVVQPAAVLEVAAGTGVVTRAMASRLHPTTAITATDLNQPMIDHAAALGTHRPVNWRQADGSDLPFEVIRADLTRAGFTSTLQIDTIEARSRAASCTAPAIGFCQGSPLRNEIEARAASRLAEATAAAAAAIGNRFGQSDIDGKMQAHVITAVKP
jgi:SAM-dependent methyltransferase